MFSSTNGIFTSGKKKTLLTSALLNGPTVMFDPLTKSFTEIELWLTGHAKTNPVFTEHAEIDPFLHDDGAGESLQMDSTVDGLWQTDGAEIDLSRGGHMEVEALNMKEKNKAVSQQIGTDT